MKKNIANGAKKLSYLGLALSALFFSLNLFFCLPVLAAATDPINFRPSVSIPGSNFQAGATTTFSERSIGYIGQYISGFYNYAMAIVGILAVIVLMIAGVIWLTSGGNPNKVGQAKDLISGALVGLGLLLGSWILLNTVNPDLVKFKVTPIRGIKPMINCCDQTKGNQVVEDSECAAPAVICQAGENCSNDGTNKFFCLDESKYFCCEYQNGSGGELLCDSVKTGENCQSLPGWDYLKSYTGRYCGLKQTIPYGTSCEGNSQCLDSDEGDVCANGYCYSGVCWKSLGKIGEPCGNRGGSKCYAPNNGENCGKNEAGQELYRDASGGRDCSSDLWCCNPSK